VRGALVAARVGRCWNLLSPLISNAASHQSLASDRLICDLPCDGNPAGTSSTSPNVWHNRPFAPRFGPHERCSQGMKCGRVWHCSGTFRHVQALSFRGPGALVALEASPADEVIPRAHPSRLCCLTLQVRWEELLSAWHRWLSLLRSDLRLTSPSQSASSTPGDETRIAGSPCSWLASGYYDWPKFG